VGEGACAYVERTRHFSSLADIDIKNQGLVDDAIRLTVSDNTSEPIKEARQSVSDYRNSLLTASGLLITIPFLAESILVSFGRFSHLQVIEITIPMLASAISFSLAIYLVVSSHRKATSASVAEMALFIAQNPPREVPKSIEKKDLEAIRKEAPELINMPFGFRKLSARQFTVAERYFELGVGALVISLVVLAFVLVS